MPTSPRALGAIEAERAQGEIGVSAICAWEVMEWAASGRLGLRTEPAVWLRQFSALPCLRLISVSPEIALGAARLPAPAPQPLSSRLILATARQLACPLVAGSAALRAYPHVKIVW